MYTEARALMWQFGYGVNFLNQNMTLFHMQALVLWASGKRMQKKICNNNIKAIIVVVYDRHCVDIYVYLSITS